MPNTHNLKDATHAIAEHMPHIGKRKLKSLLAVFIGFWFWQLLRVFFPALETHPIFIYIYGLIEIRDSSEKTVDLGGKRIKATFVAIAVGMPILALSDWLKGFWSAEWTHTAIEVILLLLGILLTLLVAEKVGCKAFCGLAAAIFVILMISHADDERYIYALFRAFQTIIGVFIAWLVNVKWFPYPGKPKETAG